MIMKPAPPQSAIMQKVSATRRRERYFLHDRGGEALSRRQHS
jgi:hypothetical protein